MKEAAASDAQIFVVSDGTGQTAADTARAAMAQFSRDWRMRTFPNVRSNRAAERVARLAAESGALVVFTLVNPQVEHVLRSACESARVPLIDLLGPLITKVAQHLQAEPRHKEGLLHGMGADYFHRVEAVEFAVRHDDGANLATLYDADLVLTGVSRTSKTPLSMYLAQRGYKTGNVPLVPGLPPPSPLLDLNPHKVFGLVLQPGRLVEIRRARTRTLGSAPFYDYASPEAIELELREARRLCRSRGWRMVDISERAVEENASRILELYQAAAAHDPRLKAPR